MPYRLDPEDKTKVQLKKNGRWITAPGGKHESEKEARGHLYKLNMYVHQMHQKGKEV